MTARALFHASFAVLAVAGAACSRSGQAPARPAPAVADSPDPGYRAPPVLLAPVRTADGAVSLTGRAAPSAKVRMVSPQGAQLETTADGSGVWTAPLGPVSEPTLYRLAEQRGGQWVDGEGLVAVLPGAPTVVLLRAGSGAQVQDVPTGALKILAVDYDSGGGAVVSGRARPSSPVRVLIDGQLAVEGSVGQDGRFSLTLPKAVEPGQHGLQVMTPQASAQASVPLSAPSVPKDAPYRATSEPFGWRIDWTTAGGGAQATLLLGG